MSLPTLTQAQCSPVRQFQLPILSDQSHVIPFKGDTLFTGGCGRFFEGTGAEMHRALSYLGTLPSETLVYNGHEYTKGNLAFNRSVDPDGAGTQRLQKLVKENEVTTGKTTIADEKEWNVFMRLGSEAVL
jgi:hydroxyacylglutathione hydrolase